MYSLKHSPAAAMNDFMMLETVTEDTDDVELAFWETVEDATHDDDDDDESALTSPQWAIVEQIMGCKIYSLHTFVGITSGLLAVIQFYLYFVIS